jgi:hypothetical protein
MADNGNGKAAPAQADGGSAVMDRVPAKWAGWFGVALTFLALIGFIVIARVLPSESLGFGALAGVAVLSISLTSLIIIARAIGIIDNSAALGLPSGSIRALLALGLAIVFVAVASWTLGGLFDPIGKLVTQVTRPPSERENLLKSYPDKDFFIFETQQKTEANAPASSEFKIYMKRGVDQNLVDMAKQILTVSATVLVTIIGFYFGSNSAADAARTVSDALKGPGGDGTTDAPPITDPQQAASTIASIAAATKGKLQSYGDDPMALLKRAVAGSTDSELMSALATAQDQLAILTAKANATATDADRAKEAAAAAAAASTDSVAVKLAKDQLGRLMADATAANHDFDQAWAKFQDARNTILRKTAKG